MIDDTAAADGRLRASHADREQVIGTLKAAFVQGMLAKDEFDDRVGHALASRTYAELAALTADLPVKPVEAVRDRPPMGNAAKAAICVAIAIAVPAVLTVATGLALFLVFIPFYFVALLAAGAQMLDSWHEKRSHPRPPPPPGQGGQRRALPPARPVAVHPRCRD